MTRLIFPLGHVERDIYLKSVVWKSEPIREMEDGGVSSHEVNAEQRLFVASFNAGEATTERRLGHNETLVNWWEDDQMCVIKRSAMLWGWGPVGVPSCGGASRVFCDSFCGSRLPQWGDEAVSTLTLGQIYLQLRECVGFYLKWSSDTSLLL